MRYHTVQVHSSNDGPPKEEQLAWKIAAVASDPAPIMSNVTNTVINRVIDNAGVAAAAINQVPVVIARSEALARPRLGGATVFGVANSDKFHAEWATWANTTAVRQLDLHDTFLAADYSHPADNIPALIAVAQQCGKNGADLVRGIVAAYEIQIALVKSICLHKYSKDHVAHLGPAVVAGIGALLELDVDTIYQAVQHAVHISFATRQSRRGLISSWKAFAPAHVTKLGIEAVDHALRGGQSPSPIYEGQDGVIAAMLAGPNAVYVVSLPETGEPRVGILESYAKEHSAEYQAQALIDLAFKVRNRILQFDMIEAITLYTSQHTHFVIGSGSGDPQKYDPTATRETLDHSAMYVFAVALEDGYWHHITSYSPERANRASTKRLWRKIITKECSDWTRRYDEVDPAKRSFGARVEIDLKSGSVIEDELAVAYAHPRGSRPFNRAAYIRKYRSLTEGIVADAEAERFLTLAEHLPHLSKEDVRALNIQVSQSILDKSLNANKGLL
jgi:2-methylcitrate dehydratase